MPQDAEALRLKALPPGISAIVFPDSSHAENAAGSSAALSILCVAIALRDSRSQRCFPASVPPFRTPRFS